MPRFLVTTWPSWLAIDFVLLSAKFGLLECSLPCCNVPAAFDAAFLFRRRFDRGSWVVLHGQVSKDFELGLVGCSTRTGSEPLAR